jgi:uncharacterized protein DUF2834
MAASSSQWLRYVYLALCVVGVLLPYWQFVPWFLQHGFDLPLFLHQLFANRIGGFFGLDVIVASFVLWVFVLQKAVASVCDTSGFLLSAVFWLAYRLDFRFFFTCARFTLIKPPSNHAMQPTAGPAR